MDKIGFIGTGLKRSTFQADAACYTDGAVVHSMTVITSLSRPPKEFCKTRPWACYGCSFGWFCCGLGEKEMRVSTAGTVNFHYTLQTALPCVPQSWTATRERAAPTAFTGCAELGYHVGHLLTDTLLPAPYCKGFLSVQLPL